MRPLVFLTAAALWLAPPLVTGQAVAGCGGHGTSVEFEDTPSEAAQKALKEQKLVFVLHVSGNFEDPRFT